jgi:hypothetical protein
MQLKKKSTNNDSNAFGILVQIPERKETRMFPNARSAPLSLLKGETSKTIS